MPRRSCPTSGSLRSAGVLNFTPIGSAILWAPFYGGGHVVAIATGAPRDGYSKPYVAAVAYGSAYYGFVAALISGAIAVRVVGRGAGATLAVWFGTPLVFYMYIAPGFGHATSAFAVALFIVDVAAGPRVVVASRRDRARRGGRVDGDGP